jgi:hypothetical protein
VGRSKARRGDAPSPEAVGMLGLSRPTLCNTRAVTLRANGSRGRRLVAVLGTVPPGH